MKQKEYKDNALYSFCLREMIINYPNFSLSIQSEYSLKIP
jgi:hypothetical protein